MMNNKTNNQQSLYKTNSNFGNISNYMTDSKSKLRPISALSRKEGIKNYPEMLNQKSNLKPYINKHTKNSFKYNTQSVQKQKQNKSNTSINIINNINNISTLNLNNNNNNNLSQTSLFNKNNNINNNNGNNNNLTNSMLMNIIPSTNSQNNYHSNTNNINIRNSEKINTNKTTPVSNSLPKFKLTTTTPMSNIMPLNDIEKLYEECINLRNTNNIQSKEIISLKSEIQKKENEIIKNSKYLSKYILNSNDYSGFPNININSPSNTNTNTYTNQNNISVINSIKETQLIHKLKQQYKETKNEINDKNIQILELKKTLKYTRIQEIANENNILKEELKKLRLVIKEFEDKDKLVDNINKEKMMLKDINAKLVFELKNKSEEIKKMEEFYNKIIHEKELEIKNNINKQVNYSNSNSYGNKNQDVSISSSGFDVNFPGHCNALIDILCKVYSKNEELTDNHIKNTKDKVNSNSKTNKKKLREDDNNNDTNVISNYKCLVNKLNEITGKNKLSNKINDLEKELSYLNNQIKLSKSSTKNNNNIDNNNKLKLTELSMKEKEAILAKQSKPRKGKKLKKMYYTSKTETYNNNFIDNILFNFEEETNKASIAKSNNNPSNNSNHSKNQKKQKSLSEEEVNEYTYILIKNLEVLCLGPEQLEEVS